MTRITVSACLKAGDVLLLEAGKTFMEANKKNEQNNAFTLISEVQNSSPPRFRMLFPAVFLSVATYVCYMVKGLVPTAEARAAIRWEIFLTLFKDLSI
jgi:hypothetical protein